MISFCVGSLAYTPGVFAEVLQAISAGKINLDGLFTANPKVRRPPVCVDQGEHCPTLRDSLVARCNRGRIRSLEKPWRGAHQDSGLSMRGKRG